MNCALWNNMWNATARTGESLLTHRCAKICNCPSRPPPSARLPPPPPNCKKPHPSFHQPFAAQRNHVIKSNVITHQSEHFFGVAGNEAPNHYKTPSRRILDMILWARVKSDSLIPRVSLSSAGPGRYSEQKERVATLPSPLCVILDLLRVTFDDCAEGQDDLSSACYPVCVIWTGLFACVCVRARPLENA
jgi:hypothetical protein